MGASIVPWVLGLSLPSNVVGDLVCGLFLRYLSARMHPKQAGPDLSQLPMQRGLD
jgi:hypothetical protein